MKISWDEALQMVEEKKKIDAINDNLCKLYHAVNLMMLRLGADGEVNSQQNEVGIVLSVLAEIDGGTYDSAFGKEKP